MVTELDQRRLKDGKTALALLKPSSIQEMKTQIIQFTDTIRAMQSLDNLGSVEANESAWNDMVTLTKKRNAIQEELKRKK